MTAEEVAICDLALVAMYARARAAHRIPLLGDLLWVPRHPSDHRGDVDHRFVCSLSTRLARGVEGSLGDLFSQPTNVTLDGVLTMFNASALDDARAPGVPGHRAS
jgi:hypothetical protein